MMHSVVAKGGPLHGKRYEVPHGLPTFSAVGGEYHVRDGAAFWQPDEDAGLARAATAARSGKTVIIVGEHVRDATEAFLEVAALSDDAERITRSPGKQRIAFPSGGRVAAVSVRGSGYRGMNADVLYVMPGVPQGALTDLLPCLFPSNGIVLHHDA